MQLGIVGQEAPELGLDRWMNGEGKPSEPVRLSDCKGKVIYLLFWQSWCPGCHTIGFPTLQKLSEHFAGDGRIMFLAVQTVFEGFQTNTEDKIPAIQQKYGLRIPMAHDPGKGTQEEPSSLMMKYRTGGTPWVVIIDKVGVVRFNGFHVDEKEVILCLEDLTE